MSGAVPEFAKFFSGFALMQSLFHGALLLSEDALPLRLLGVTMTSGMNTPAAILWPLAALYLGWGRRLARRG